MILPRKRNRRFPRKLNDTPRALRTEPLEPRLMLTDHALADFVVFGGNRARIRNNVAVDVDGVLGSNSVVRLSAGAESGDIRSNTNVVLERSVVVEGDITAGSNVKMGHQSQVSGDVIAGGTIRVSGNPRIFGASTEKVTPPPTTDIDLPVTSAQSSRKHIRNPARPVIDLEPDQYGVLKLQANKTLVLSAGRYDFRKILAKQNLHLRLNLSADESIEIFVKGRVQIGPNLRVTVNGADYASADKQLAANVYLEADDRVVFGHGGQWFGTAYAPNGKVKVRSSAASPGNFTGALISGTRALVQPFTEGTFVPSDRFLAPRIDLDESNGNPPVFGLPLNGTVADVNRDVAFEAGFDGSFVPVSVDSAGRFQITPLVLDALPNGGTELLIRATDSFGNMSELPVPVDLSPVSVSISAPAPGLVTRYPVTVTGQVNKGGSGIASVTATLNGVPLSITPDAEGDFILPGLPPGFMADGSTDGVYVVEIRATDAADNTSDPEQRTFTIDTIVKPEPTLRIFDEGQEITGQTDAEVVTLRGMTEASATVVLNGIEPGITVGEDGVFEFPDIPLEAGVNVFTIVVTDALGNSAEDTQQITRFGPVITARLANDTAPGQTTNFDRITSDPTIEGTVSGTDTITKLEARLETSREEFTPEDRIAFGESRLLIEEHHDEPGHPGSPNTHFFAETGDEHHFAWLDQDPSTPDVIDVYYDFRDLNGFPNLITASQQTAADAAFDAWEDDDVGTRLKFTRNETASADDIINIGVGDLAALDSITGAGGVLALGGGIYTHSIDHTITRGVAWMDSAEAWDNAIGNGDVADTFDFYTVTKHEIGHALGLGHMDDLEAEDVMDGTYSGEKASLSANDIEHIQVLYGSVEHVEPVFQPITELITAGEYTLDMQKLEELRGGTLVDGPYRLQLRAEDASGTIAEIERTFVLDNTQPSPLPIPADIAAGTVSQTFSSFDVNFGEPVDSVAFDAGTYSLTFVGGQQDGDTVAIERVDQSNESTARIVLEAPLADHDYWLVVQSGVSDVAGIVSAASEFPFTVADPTGIQQISPADGEAMVNVTRETIIRFDETVDMLTVTDDAFHLIANGERVPGRIDVSTTERFATFFYHEPLPASTGVRVVVNGDLIMGRDGFPIDADGDNEPGGTAIADFRTLPLTPIPNTNVAGTVLDSYTGHPIKNVTIRVDAFGDAANAVTLDDGTFELVDMPAPEFFVHIDGSTATHLNVDGTLVGIDRDVTTYPNVGKPFHSFPGDDFVLPFEINLPPITLSDREPVIEGTETAVGIASSGITILSEKLGDDPLFPGVADPSAWNQLQVTIPADSAMTDSGDLATNFAVIPVPPAFLPAPLPPGLEPDLVISVQATRTDPETGEVTNVTNFDVPAPVVFPNTRELDPFEKQAIISFNHDAGRWEAAGTATVSVDGLTVVSDPGSGIRAPGWHSLGPLPETPPPPPPECNDSAGLHSMTDDSLVVAGRRQRTPCPQSPERRKCLGNCRMTFFTECLPVAALGGFSGGQGLAIGVSACVYLLLVCEEKCPAHQSCPSCTSASTSERATNLVVDAIADDIAAIGQQIIGLIRPFVLSRQDLPSPVQIEVDGLTLQANELAGGDAAEFLHAATLQRELDTAAENIGSAPPYSVMYAAQVVRADGETIVVRGRTEAHGQYSIFVPRGGRIGQVSFYDPRTHSFGAVTPNLRPDAPYRLPRFDLYPVDEEYSDFDDDRLADVVEFVYGTEYDNPDSDGDGITDGAEIEQGLDPLGGSILVTGIVASVPLQGQSQEVVLEGSLLDSGSLTAYVATGTHGMAIVDATQFTNPIVLGQLELAGGTDETNFALDIAVDSRLQIAAVAGGTSGLHLVDVSDDMLPEFMVTIAGNATQVEVLDGIAYVSMDNALEAWDLLTAERLQRLPFGGETITGLAREGSVLYTREDGTTPLRAVDISGPEMEAGAAKPLSIKGGGRLFVGNGVAYVPETPVDPPVRGGYATVDVSDPENLTLISASDVDHTEFAPGTAFAANGSGRGIRVGSPLGMPRADLVDVTDPLQTHVPLDPPVIFSLPPSPNAVTIGAGVAFLATDAGLQVLNYEPFDTGDNPPMISIETSGMDIDMDPVAPGIQVEDGTLIPITADISDDVQVRNVELLVNGEVVRNDVSFPWDLQATAVGLADGLTQTIIEVRATDTGGNSRTSAPIPVNLVPDIFPPMVEKVTPDDGQLRSRNQRTVRLFFTEGMDESTLTPENVRLLNSAGQELTPVDVRVRHNGQSLQLTYSGESGVPDSPLPTGAYDIVIAANRITDRAGNALGTSDMTTSFTVVAADVVWDNDAGGEWNDPGNWDTGELPGPDDDVLLTVAENVTITHRGSNTIGSLSGTGQLVLGKDTQNNEDDILEVTTIELASPIVMEGGVLKDARVAPVGGGYALNVMTTVFGGTLDNVTVVGDIMFQGDSATPTILKIRNGLELKGYPDPEDMTKTVTPTVTIRTTGSGRAQLEFEGTGILKGTGDVVFEGKKRGAGFNGSAEIIAEELTVEAGITIRGSGGSIGNSDSSPTGELINHGTIRAESPANSGDLIFVKYTLTNGTGRLEATGDGMMNTADGTLVIMDLQGDSGAISASGGGHVSLNGTYTFSTPMEPEEEMEPEEKKVELAENGKLTLNGDWTKTSDFNADDSTVNFGGEFTPTDIGTIIGTGNTFNITGTLINPTPTSEFYIDGANGIWKLRGGTIQNGILKSMDADVTLEVSSETFSHPSGTLDGVTLETKLNKSGGTLSIVNGLKLNNAVDATGFLQFVGSQTLETGSSGEVTLSGFIQFPEDTLTVGPGVTIHGPSVTLGSTTSVELINKGVIEARAIEVGGEIFEEIVELNTHLVNQGTIKAGVHATTIHGSPTLGGRISARGIRNEGTLRVEPGASVTTNNSTTNFEQTAAGKIEFLVKGTGFREFGTVDFSGGEAQFDGELVLEFDSGFVPTPEQTFLLIKYTSYTGALTLNAPTVSGVTFSLKPEKVGSDMFLTVNVAAALQSSVASGAGAPGSVMLENELPQGILNVAMAHWLDAGVNSADLQQIDVRIGQLPDSILGSATSRTIWIDDDAAGHGWFVDPTPFDDAEFVWDGRRELVARDEGPADGLMDLLTVVAHELGHVLGLPDVTADDTGHNVMQSSLLSGARRLPSFGNLEILPPSGLDVDLVELDALFADAEGDYLS